MQRLLRLAVVLAMACGVPMAAHAQDKAAARQTMMVEGGGGLPIAVTVAGNRQGPALLFVHSLMASTMNWEKQFESDLGRTHRLVSLDMRGHGASAKPLLTSAYTDSRLHAEDIRAAIRASGIKKPTLVAWAYGGLNVMDYVRHFGTGDIAGIVLVEANGGLEPTPEAVKTQEYLERIGRSQSPDLKTIREWTLGFGEYLMRGGPLPPNEAEIIHTSSMMVPHWVRAAMRERPTDNSDLVQRLDVPVSFIVTIENGVGRQMIDRIAGRLKTSEVRLIPTGGSMSFWYETDKFNAELRRLSPAK